MKKEIKKKEIALVYLAAGISSRFKGKIKQLVKINSKTLIEHSLNQALKSNFSKIIFIVGNKTELAFKKKFKEFYKGVPIFYALQKYDEKKRDKPWGTADALCSASPILDCPFVICNGDDIYGEHTFKILVNHLNKSKDSAIVGYKLKASLPDKGEVNRGIINTKNKYLKELKDAINISRSNLSNLSPNNLSGMGIYAFHPNDLKLIEKRVKKFKEKNKRSKKAEIGLPDQITSLIKRKKLKMKVYHAKNKWYGITNLGDEKIIRKQLKSKEIRL